MTSRHNDSDQARRVRLVSIRERLREHTIHSDTLRPFQDGGYRIMFRRSGSAWSYESAYRRGDYLSRELQTSFDQDPPTRNMETNVLYRDGDQGWKVIIVKADVPSRDDPLVADEVRSLEEGGLLIHIINDSRAGGQPAPVQPAPRFEATFGRLTAPARSLSLADAARSSAQAAPAPLARESNPRDDEPAGPIDISVENDTLAITIASLNVQEAFRANRLIQQQVKYLSSNGYLEEAFSPEGGEFVCDFVDTSLEYNEPVQKMGMRFKSRRIFVFFTLSFNTSLSDRRNDDSLEVEIGVYPFASEEDEQESDTPVVSGSYKLRGIFPGIERTPELIEEERPILDQLDSDMGKYRNIVDTLLGFISENKNKLPI